MLDGDPGRIEAKRLFGALLVAPGYICCHLGPFCMSKEGLRTASQVRHIAHPLGVDQAKRPAVLPWTTICSSPT